MKVSYQWLQTYFDTPLPSAKELGELLMFHSFEVEGVTPVGDDFVIDVDVLPNRSSDCLSHRGIAREIATLLSRPLQRDPLRDTIPTIPVLDELSIEVDDIRACTRYMGVVVRGVTVGPSPAWLVARLEALGQRSVNNIVDATNYVMLETGQPLHVFDYDKLGVAEDGSRKIHVRLADEGEQITVLSGETYSLPHTATLITDGVTNAPLAIAGIKGGKEAEIDAETTHVLLEAGNFFYRTVRQTAKALKLSTEASLRFQNDPAPELVQFGMSALVSLITDIAGGEVRGARDEYVERGERTPVDVTLERINALLGISLTYDDVERILVRFEWEFSRDKDEFAVTPPWERTDIRIAEDVIEEVGRVHGYSSLSSLVPKPLPESPAINKRVWYTNEVRRVLLEKGYSEVYTYTLQDAGEVELLNPLASDKSCMRNDLRRGVLGALDTNVHHAPYLGLDTVKLFEVGTVFRAHGEVLHVAVGARAVAGKQSKADKTLMEDMAELADTLGFTLTDEKVSEGVLEFNVEALLGELPEKEGYHPDTLWNPTVRYAPWSVYPAMYRDIAVWVPAGVPAEEVLAVVVEIAPDTLVRHYQFDTFEKEGRVSYAWHLVFQSTEKTLTDTEVGGVLDSITEALNAREGWEVR